MATGSYSGSPSASAATVVTDPASPTRVAASRDRHLLGDQRQRRSDVGDGRLHLARPSAGRRAGAARSAARSRCPPTGPPAGRPRRRARTPSSRRRCRRRGTAAGARPAVRRRRRLQRRGRAEEGELRLLAAGDDVGQPAQRRPHHLLEVVPVGGVPGGAGGDHAHAVGARARARCRRTRPARRGCARSPRRASRPVASTPWPSRTTSIRRTRSVAPPVGRDVGDEQADGVGAAVDRRDPGHAAPSGSAHGPWPTTPPSPSTARSPIGFTPGPAASACPASACRHLTRSGMPPAVARVGSTSLASPLGEVGLVRARGTRRPAPGRCPARPATRASGRRTPAGWRRPTPAGRSGSTASGTGCRPRAGARSPRRRAGRTGSGARPPSRARGGRPSCRSTTSRSAGVTARSLVGLLGDVAVGAGDRLHQPLEPGLRLGRGGRLVQRAGVALDRLAVDDDDSRSPGST